MSAAHEQIIALTGTELALLHGSGPLAFSLYVLLRGWMDFASGAVGRSRPISLAMLAAYTETHTPRGGGVQVEQASERNIRTALTRLVCSGLLRRLAGDRLAFALPKALTAAERPAQTRHDAAAHLSTARPARKPRSRAALRRPAGAAPAPVQASNPTHIKNHGYTSTPQTPAPAQPPLLSAKGMSDEALLAFGTRHGAPPRPGESWADYRRRLARGGVQKMDQQQGETHA